MDNFDSLQDLYEYIESEAHNLKYISNISDLFRGLRDQYHESGMQLEKNQAQWEIDFFNFVIDGNNCKALWSGTSEDGQVIEYPDFKYFTEETYNYLEERFKYTKNYLLKARYGHLLWLRLRKKHRCYALAAIDSYLELVDLYEEDNKHDPNGIAGKKVCDYIKCAYYLCNSVRGDFSRICTRIIKLVKDFNFKSQWQFSLRTDLINLMLKHNKRFRKESFDGISNICWDNSIVLYKDCRMQDAIDLLEIGEKVERKLGKTNTKWRHQIGKMYEELMKRSTSNLMAINYCQEALNIFRKLKNKEKIDELKGKFKEGQVLFSL